MNEKSVTLEIRCCCEYERVSWVAPQARGNFLVSGPNETLSIYSDLEHACEVRSIFIICQYS